MQSHCGQHRLWNWVRVRSSSRSILPEAGHIAGQESPEPWSDQCPYVQLCVVITAIRKRLRLIGGHKHTWFPARKGSDIWRLAHREAETSLNYWDCPSCQLNIQQRAIELCQIVSRNLYLYTSWSPRAQVKELISSNLGYMVSRIRYGSCV